MSNKAVVIMLSGYMQSGKDTVGSFLCSSFNFVRYAFADVLKDEVSELYNLDRASLDTQEGKSQLLKGDTRTVRDLLISHGQQRRAENVNHWVDKVVSKIKRDAILSPHGQPRIVITDWRFPNEYHRIKEQLQTDRFRTTVYSWRVDRCDKPPFIDVTETALDTFPFDLVLSNKKCIRTLEYWTKHNIYMNKDVNLTLLVTDVDDVLL